MASGMDHGRVRPTTTTSLNMAAIQLIPSHYSVFTVVLGMCALREFLSL